VSMDIDNLRIGHPFFGKTKAGAGLNLARLSPMPASCTVRWRTYAGKQARYAEDS
jgi:hypothetical protein